MHARACLSLAVAFAACGQPGRDTVDALVPPDGPHCGNGVIEIELGESCDDGPVTGTTQSMCTKQCERATMGLWAPAVRQVPLDLPAKRVVRVTFWGEDTSGVAYTAYDDAGVHVLRNFGINEPLEYVPLKVQAAPVTLGAIQVDSLTSTVPIWVERASDGLHLYLADVPSPAAAPPTIYEVPYPFADGTRPQLFASRARVTAMLVDQSAVPPYDLLVALFMARTPTDVTTVTLRVPAPGRVRGVALESTELDFSLQKMVEQVVQFFEDSPSFVAFANLVPNDFCVCDLQLYESGRGSWPFKVVGGTAWQEGGSSIQPPIPANMHPPAFMILTDTGALYAWQFVEGISGEAFIAPFGHMPAGTRVVGAVPDGIMGVWGLQPDGTVRVLKDADPLDMRSGSLMPQELMGIGPWVESSSFGDSGMERGFVADGTLRTAEQ